MTKNIFVEFHVLTSHSPSNLNRDELGSPKTALFGGSRRLRISSQCLKRSWRMSDYFRGQFAEDLLGVRTARLPSYLKEQLTSKKVSDDVIEGLLLILQQIGKGEGGEVKDPEKTSHLLYLSKEEIKAIEDFATENASKLERIFKEKPAKKEKGAKKEKKASTEEAPAEAKKKEEDPLKEVREALGKYLRDKCKRNAVDVALFGRFVTSDEIQTVDAAMQVAHALGTHKVEIEYDYFTAMDDWQPKDQTGSAHIGESEFAASVFYKYAACNFGLLQKNLNQEKDLGAKSMKAIALAIARSVPDGKKNSTAPQNCADYVEVVIRRDAPMSLANAFLEPVSGKDSPDFMKGSIKRLRDRAEAYQKAYGISGDIVGRFVLSPAYEVKGALDNIDALAAAIEKKLLEVAP